MTDLSFTALRILVIEDEPDLCEAMTAYLSLEDFAAIGVNTAEEADKYIKNNGIDIAIVDVGLPGRDGVAWLRQQQRQGPLPFGVVMVTAHTEAADRLRGRHAGADVYLTKPVDFEELLIVLRNLSARLGRQTHERPRWMLDSIGWHLQAPDGQRVKLTGSECRLLQRLAESPGSAVARDALISSLGHQPDSYDPRRMEILVRRLRNKIREQLLTHLPLETMHGVGYAFTADIRLA